MGMNSLIIVENMLSYDAVQIWISDFIHPPLGNHTKKQRYLKDLYS